MKPLKRAVALPVLLMSAAAFANPPLPAAAPDTHLGAKSCGESSCHGAREPSPFAVVQQDEYRIWKEQDAHARAFRTLGGARAKTIARNLGLGDPQQEALCLDCHTDHVPAAKRGKNFSLADGVGCEACHGGAERWLGDHSNGRRSHAQNLADGMFPTADPQQRARLCFSCHMGTPEKPVTHALLGAGHPRLAIELDTFTVARPAHHVEDADWHKRKPGNSIVRTWAVGQAQAALRWLELARAPAMQKSGPMPESSLYECHGCHRLITPESGGAGEPRLDDSHLQMLVLVARRVAPAVAPELEAGLRALTRASDRAGQKRALDALAPHAAKVSSAAAGHGYGKDDARVWLRTLLQEAAAGQYAGYARAEKATYAVAALIAALDAGSKNVDAAMDAMYKATADGSRFEPSKWKAAAARVEQGLTGALK